MINKNLMFDILLSKFRSIGIERSFKTLSIEELDKLSRELIEEIETENKKIDEPPF